MNLRNTLANLYPEGSKGGQCAFFVRKLADIKPLGNLYTEKQYNVKKYGILAKQLQGDFRVGDVVITSEGLTKDESYGHALFVNNIIGDDLICTESNFKGNEKVSHTRKLNKLSSKIYGVIRAPFKFNFFQFPLQLNVTVLMNHEKQWKGDNFTQLAEWFTEKTKGKISLKISPLYTQNSLKNWWYRTERTDFGGEFKVIDRGFVVEQALPLRFPDSHFVLWCINNKQWEGSAFNNGQLTEYGWWYRGTNIATIACDEQDKSFRYNLPAFVHYGAHEILHFLEHYGNRRGLQMTDLFDQNGDLAATFNNIEFDYLCANL